jgi:hypothetical protein
MLTDKALGVGCGLKWSKVVTEIWLFGASGMPVETPAIDEKTPK